MSLLEITRNRARQNSPTFKLYQLVLKAMLTVLLYSTIYIKDILWYVHLKSGVNLHDLSYKV